MTAGIKIMQTTFSEISARYERDSLIQKSAAEKLLGLIDIKENDSVLDLGCGTGSIARRIRALTQGAVVGADASSGMIQEAKSGGKDLDIAFVLKKAEELDYREVFTAIFCNSTFQWFSDPALALKKCHAALVNRGRIGIQAPAKKLYCPNFMRAIEAVALDSRTASTYSGFSPPWIFLDTADEYASIFKQAGFDVPFAVIEEIKTLHKPDQVMTIFESGAAAGYLNQKFHAVPIGEAYTKAFREIVREAFHQQANERGLVELIFNRIYLLGVK